MAVLPTNKLAVPSLALLQVQLRNTQREKSETQTQKQTIVDFGLARNVSRSGRRIREWKNVRIDWRTAKQDSYGLGSISYHQIHAYASIKLYNPQHATLYHLPSTLNPQTYTKHPTPYTLHPRPHSPHPTY
jgi:hypothetical protein